eukprot:NODE_1495_length_1929_cov_50.109081_g1188_i1.p1 GENE.NODE_1495_length_1929_cov_50.109081_g1188_i1~~NODE_1495_length_1929_cov_50.109081_g1188_i1.p1  ORF type:complete len:615 (+),score=177.34 NODE_1495_length_1929_cov_50.109081_g1188_i1:58-1902(+)
MAACGFIPKSQRDAASQPIFYPDEKLLKILQTVKVIAMVGASTNWNRPSYFVMKYLQQKGYRIIPVNPTSAGQTLLEETIYPDIKSIPHKIDMVQVFRRSDTVGPVVDEVIAQKEEKGIKVLWMQLGVRNDVEGARAEAVGVELIMNRCPKIEFGRLGGELGWYGVNSGIVSSKPQMPPNHPAARSKATTQAGFGTLAVHGGASPDPTTGARCTPIFQTTSYVFNDVEDAATRFNLHTFGHIYSRLGNPTNCVLEQKIAALEGGRAALCCASGHAAQFLTFFTLLGPGDEFIASRNLYGGSLTQFGLSFKKLGWTCHFVDPLDPNNFRAALTDKVKAIFIEVIANPGGIILDIDAIAEVAKEAKIPLIVDNTLATPYLLRPIEHGATIVVHSTTKFLAGHGNSLGGAIVESGRFNWAATDKFPCMTQPEPAYHGLVFYETFGDFGFVTKARAIALRDFGPSMSPFNAFLTLTGMETLHLRMDRHCKNALQVAEFLNSHPSVAWVSYPGLPENKFHPIAQKYLKRGFGAVFTFGVKGGMRSGMAIVEKVQIWSHLANVGDTRSLVLHPASTTHRQLTEEQRQNAGAGEDVIRLSVGLEDVEDLISDLKQALDTLV